MDRHRLKRKAGRRKRSHDVKLPDIFTKEEKVRPVARETAKTSCQSGRDTATPRHPRKESTSYESLIQNENFDAYDSDEEKVVCEKCKKILLNLEENFNGDEDMPGQVLSIIDRLRNAVKRRKQQETEDEMKEIMGRVAVALKHSGMDGTEGDVRRDAKHPFNVEEEKAKKAERKFIKDVFKSGQTTIRVRKELILELKAWFDVLRNEWEAVCSSDSSTGVPEEECQRIMEAFQDSSEAVRKIETLFQKGIKKAMSQPPPTSKHLPNIQALMTLTDSDEDLSPSESAVSFGLSEQKLEGLAAAQPPDMENLATGPSYLKRGFEKISTALQKAMDPRADAKKHIKTVRKQFKWISNAFEKRDEKIDELQTEIERATTESIGQKNYYQQQRDNDFETICKMTDHRDELEEKIKELEEQLRQPIEPIIQQQSQSLHPYDDFQRERKTIQIDTDLHVINSDGNLSKGKKKKKKTPQGGQRLNRRHTIAANALSLKASLGSLGLAGNGSSSGSDTECKDIVEENDDGLVMEDLRGQLAEQEKQLATVNEKLSSQEEEMSNLNEQCNEKSEEMSILIENNKTKDAKIEELEAQVKTLVLQINERTAERKNVPELGSIKNDEESIPSNGQVSSQKSVLDTTARHHALVRMEKLWKKEVQTLRDFIEKERQRYIAKRRAHDLDQKKIENHIREDNAHMMRALYRFKRVIGRLLQSGGGDMDDMLEEGEAELLKAYQENTTDADLSGTAVEILVNLEQSLAKALLSKKLEMKDKHKEKINAVKHLKEYQTRLSNTKNICEKQENFVKMTADQNTVLTNAYQKLLLNNEWLTKKLAHQPELISKYVSMDPATVFESIMEADQLQSKAQQENENPENVENELILHTGGPATVQETEETLQLKDEEEDGNTMFRASRKHKTKLIKNALTNNQMSLVDYHKAQDIIARGAAVSKQMLIRLVQRYVAERRMESLKKILSTHDGRHKSSKRFEKYLTMSQKRYEETLQRFELRKTELRREREDSILKFGDVVEKRILGGLNIQSYNNVDHLSHMATKLAITNGRVDKASNDTKINDIVGKPLRDSSSTISYWKMPPYVSNRLVRLSVPKLLDMDVNQWKKCLEYPTTIDGRNVFTPAIASLYP